MSDTTMPTLAQVKLILVKQRLQETGGNVSWAARSLGIGRTSLIRYIEKHQIKFNSSTGVKTG